MSYVPLTELATTPRLAAEGVLEELPPHGSYDSNYQPHYPDTDALLDAVEELHVTEGVTTPRAVDMLQAELAALAQGETDRPIIITGRCAEEVSLTTPVETLVEYAVNERALVLRALQNVTVVQRNRGQAVKPRSAATEILSDGREVASYMGDAINSAHPDDRTPDPTRLVSMAVQSRDLEAGLSDAVGGHHVYAAHEALSLPYEGSFVRIDEKTGRKYLASTDLPWIGKRTNAIDGPHVKMLAEVANPIGIKIGPDSTPEHIAALHATLNPANVPGRMVLMLRMGPKHVGTLERVAGAIKEHAPGSVVMYDIHGVTRTAPTGEKIRHIGDVIEDIATTATTLRAAGLKLHGLHLETTPDDSRLECVDEPDQLPTHPGGVDPQLNPRQLAYVLEQTKGYLL